MPAAHAESIVDIADIAEALPVEAAQKKLPVGDFYIEFPVPQPIAIPEPDFFWGLSQKNMPAITTPVPAPRFCGLREASFLGPYVFIETAQQQIISDWAACDENHQLNNKWFAKLIEEKSKKTEQPYRPGAHFRAAHHHSGNYGHFLRDSLGMLEILTRFRAPKTFKPIGFGFYQTYTEKLYERMGLPNIGTYHGIKLKLEQLYFTQQTASYETFDFLKKRLSIPQIENNRRYFLTRGRMGRRNIVNEEALLPVLKKHNVTVIRPEGLSIGDQIAAFSGAELLVGMSGAALCNSVYMPPGGAILELINSFRSANYWFATFSTLSRQRFGQIEGNDRPDLEKQADHWDISIDPEILDEAITALLQRSPNR